MSKPHIIIFNPDEMRADTLAHLGNLAAITPHFDRFVREDAVSFRNAYCQNPVCVPSRCSFFTGLYPHVNGHRTMTHLLRPEERSLFSELKDNGYQIWMNDRNDLYAAQYPGWVESHSDTIFSAERTAPGPVKKYRGEPGNPYYYSHYEGQLGLDGDGKNYNDDDKAVDEAIVQIKNWKEGDKPLCIFLGLLFPHPPYEVEEPYFGAIDRTKLPARIRWEDCSHKSRMLTLYREYQHMEDFTEDQWNELRAVYQGMCMKVDHQFGRLMTALKEKGMYDDSAVFVLSDHGDFAGDYGLAEKAQSSFEDCLTKVPFMIKPPKDVAVNPGISEGLTELIDFYATALDFAGIEPGQDHFGKSLRPVLENRETKLRDYVFCEGGRNPGEFQADEYHQPGGMTARTNDAYWPKKMAQLDDAAHAKATMIRSSRFKYISRITGEDELYDMEADPQETTNLIDKPEYTEVIRHHQIELMRWLQRTSDIVPRDYDSRMTAGRIWSMVKRFVPEGYAEDVKAKINQGMSIGAVFGYVHSLPKE